MFKKYRSYALAMIVGCLFLPSVIFAQDGFEARAVDATIQSISIDEMLEGGVRRYVFSVLTLSGEVYEVDTQNSFAYGVGYTINTGDSVSLRLIDTQTGTDVYLDDVHRESRLLFIVGVFVLLTLIIGLMRGFLSLLGLLITLVILLFILFPAILNGTDPVIASTLASAAILGINMHLSHGFRKQTFYAFLSALSGLVLVVLFTDIFISIAQLSGIASEEGALLFLELGKIQIPVGILSAGIILGASGVLDDIAITQTEVIHELYIADPSSTRQELFKKGIRIGRHHIASIVNTLILVYAGAALPAFLLYMNQSIGYQAFFNNEIIAEELVRTLAGTCALVLTVPISTWFATLPHRVIDNGKNST
ncbi:YibE/F family protein [Candidatus Uhrbacteria bacterium]|nr:YibE/F family protein [Candidatus Uhrbacteria bacterium]